MPSAIEKRKSGFASMSENLFSFFANAIPDPERAFLLRDGRDAISFRVVIA